MTGTELVRTEDRTAEQRALGRLAIGHPPVAESAGYDLRPTQSLGGAVLILLLLRAFSQGCTALTGVEAVSNGVPNFRPPKGRNAALTLAIMGGLSITMFAATEPTVSASTQEAPPWSRPCGCTVR